MDKRGENGAKALKKYRENTGFNGRFSSTYQPTSEQRKAGAEWRKEKKELMKKVSKYDSMSLKEIQDIQKDMKEHPEKYTLKDVKILKWITSDKFILDYMDRRVGKATQPIDITTDGESLNMSYSYEVDSPGDEKVKDI